MLQAPGTTSRAFLERGLVCRCGLAIFALMNAYVFTLRGPAFSAFAYDGMDVHCPVREALGTASRAFLRAQVHLPLRPLPLRSVECLRPHRPGAGLLHLRVRRR